MKGLAMLIDARTEVKRLTTLERQPSWLGEIAGDGLRPPPLFMGESPAASGGSSCAPPTLVPPFGRPRRCGGLPRSGRSRGSRGPGSAGPLPRSLRRSRSDRRADSADQVDPVLLEVCGPGGHGKVASCREADLRRPITQVASTGVAVAG